MQGFKHFFSFPPINTPALTIRGIGVQEHMPACIIDRPHGTRVRDYLFMLFYDQVGVGAGKNIMSQPAASRGHLYGTLDSGEEGQNGLPYNCSQGR